MPCTEKRARLLLQRGRAVVHRLHPFTIRLKDRLLEGSVLQPVGLKLDPGSAEVPKGRRAGVHTGPVAVRASGSFKVGSADGISWRHCRLLQRADGYAYAKGGSGRSSPRLKAGASAAA